jgi:uncharacterized delta-60 repeat protein
MKKVLFITALAGSCFTLQAQPGILDPTFTPAPGLDYNGVHSVVIQPDGKVIAGGSFSRKVIRLNNDGSADPSFNPPGNGFNAFAPALALQPDGKVIVGGGFTEYNNLPIPGRLVRLNSDASLDATFITGLGTGITTDYASVEAIVLQPDGKILVGGDFQDFNGAGRRRLMRLNSNGTLDNSFIVGTGFNNTVSAICLQPDGKILVGGVFINYNGAPVPPRLIRLNSDGTVDATFSAGSGFDGWVQSVVLQSDGKIIVGGMFSNANGLPRKGIARLNSDGSVDASFDPGTGFASPPFVHDVILQPDGKILAGGQFTGYNGTTANRIVRLNNDGSIDPTFNTGTGCDMTVLGFALLPNEKIMICGEFTNYNGTARNFVARLNGNDNIKTAPVTLADICNDPDVEVPFIATGTFTTGNVFTAQLSDAAGSFTSPVAIGTLTGTASGTINATIPATTVSGTGYRIRVVSSTPPLNGDDNGEDLDIANITPAVIQATNFTLSTTVPYTTYRWFFNNNPIPGGVNATYNVGNNGSYKVAVTDANGCKDTSDVYEVTNVPVGISELDMIAAQVKIYPNPANDVISINAPVKVNVSITGIEGKVFRQEKNVSKLDIHDLAEGIYLIRITGTDGTLIKVEKLVKTK